MIRSMRVAGMAVAAILAFSSAGCGAVPDDAYAANVIVVATATSNEPGAQLPVGFEETLQDANATGYGTVTVLLSRAGRAEQIGDPILVEVLRGGTEPENDPQLIEQGLQRISAAVADRINTLAGNETALDLLTVLNAAAQHASGSTIVAISSGLQTTGLTDFTGLGWDFRNSDVVDDLRTQGFLPDLTGKKVLYVGLGDTAGQPQAPLPRPMQTKVESLWMDICRAAGAMECTAARMVTAVDPVSDVPAKTVAVPSFTLPAVPAGGGDVLLPSESLFAPDSADLLPEAQASLRLLADELRTRGATVDLVGHTWAVGPADTARALSARRAQSVADALIGLGLSPESIGVVKGVGYDALIRPAGASAAATAAANRVVIATVRPGR